MRYLVRAAQRKSQETANSEVYDDLEHYGAPDSVIEAYRESHQESLPEVPVQVVFTENREAVNVFMRSQTQWHQGAMGGRIALNYLGAESVARALGVEWSDDLLGRLQVLEAEMLGHYAEQANG